LSTWLILISFACVANARIKPPRIEELIDSADLIVIGKVESVQATPPEMWRQIGITIVLIAVVAILAFLLWRKRFAIAACLVVICLFLVLIFDVPYGTYRKISQLSVSSTIKGPPTTNDISVYYDDSFVCDVTHFDIGQEYILFLKKLSSGYTMSWYDWSVWTVKSGYAQTERRTWQDAAPIALDEFIARIEELRDRPPKKDE
jgi:hypothetical protein